MPALGPARGSEPCNRAVAIVGHHSTAHPPCRAHLALLLLALLLLVGAARGEEGPRQAADNGGHAGPAGCGGVALVELEGAHGEVHLRPRAGHGVQAVVELLPLRKQPARREHSLRHSHREQRCRRSPPLRLHRPCPSLHPLAPSPGSIPGGMHCAPQVPTSCRPCPCPSSTGTRVAPAALSRAPGTRAAHWSHLPLPGPYVLPALLFRLRFGGQPGKQKTTIKEPGAPETELGMRAPGEPHARPLRVMRGCNGIICCQQYDTTALHSNDAVSCPHPARKL